MVTVLLPRFVPGTMDTIDLQLVRIAPDIIPPMFPMTPASPAVEPKPGDMPVTGFDAPRGGLFAL